MQVLVRDAHALSDREYEVSRELLSPSLATSLMLDLHVKVQRALRTIGLIATKIWTLVYFGDLVVAPTQMSLSPAGVQKILIAAT
jgi:hypothetical protein